MMVILAWGSTCLLRSSPMLGAFATGAFLVLLDWINFTTLPIWGTAQSFVRCWSSYPNLILFVSFTGMTGIIFALGTLQALLVTIIVHPQQRPRRITAAVAIILVLTVMNLTVRYQQPIGKLKVAAIGWTSTSGDPQTDDFDMLFAQPVAKAAQAGARLIVSPEIGFWMADNEELERFRQVARRHNVYLAVGYFHSIQRENRLFFMTPQGQVAAEYTKTFLTPFEKFNRGDGTLKVIDIDGVRVGGMICQDDNFTRLSRDYSRQSVAVVAVPTLDWSTVKNAHLQNSIYRAVESRYAIVRAAADGISVIVSPMGRVLACRDHFQEGPGVIVAEVPVYSQRTTFGVLGHWPVAAGLVFLIVYVVWNFMKTKRRYVKNDSL